MGWHKYDEMVFLTSRNANKYIFCLHDGVDGTAMDDVEILRNHSAYEYHDAYVEAKSKTTCYWLLESMIATWG